MQSESTPPTTDSSSDSANTTSTGDSATASNATTFGLTDKQKQDMAVKVLQAAMQHINTNPSLAAQLQQTRSTQPTQATPSMVNTAGGR